MLERQKRFNFLVEMQSKVAFSDKLYRKYSTTPGTVAGQLLSHPIMDDTLLCTAMHKVSATKVYCKKLHMD